MKENLNLKETAYTSISLNPFSTQPSIITLTCITRQQQRLVRCNLKLYILSYKRSPCGWLVTTLVELIVFKLRCFQNSTRSNFSITQIFYEFQLTKSVDTFELQNCVKQKYPLLVKFSIEQYQRRYYYPDKRKAG